MDRDKLMTNKKTHCGEYRDSQSTTRETDEYKDSLSTTMETVMSIGIV